MELKGVPHTPQIPMIFYGLVSGLALILETGWRLAKTVGVDIPLPEVLREKPQVSVASKAQGKASM